MHHHSILSAFTTREKNRPEIACTIASKMVIYDNRTEVPFQQNGDGTYSGAQASILDGNRTATPHWRNHMPAEKKNAFADFSDFGSKFCDLFTGPTFYSTFANLDEKFRKKVMITVSIANNCTE